MEALPVRAPKQATFDCALRLAASAAAGCVMVTLRVVTHPSASVTVQFQLPAGNPVAEGPLCAGRVFHPKEYGAVPPFALMVALPVEPPKQFTFACALMLVERAAPGWVIVAVLVVVQPRASVTVHVQVPAAKLFALRPVCTGEVFQL